MMIIVRSENRRRRRVLIANFVYIIMVMRLRQVFRALKLNERFKLTTLF